MSSLNTEDVTPAVTQPLISDEQRSHSSTPERGTSPASRNNASGDEGEDAITTASSFLWLLTLAASVSGCLFGYDTGVISSTLVSVHNDLSGRPLTTLDKSLITSSTSFFALVASPVTGILSDRLGRKPILLLASILFIIGALAQAVSTTVTAMILGRSIVGVAIGSASFVAPMYVAELSPKRLRGRLVVVQTLFITGGQVIAYVVGWAFSDARNGWRWMVGLGAIPAVLQALMLFFMPESPRYLIKVGLMDQAENVLRKVYVGQEMAVQAVLRNVQREQEEEDSQSISNDDDGRVNTVKSRSLLHGNLQQLLFVPAHRRALTIACMLQGFQQLCGFNSLMYFSATIFALVGFTSPTLTSLTIALTNFFFTWIAFYTIDRVGRRRILLYSIPFMVLGLLLCALSFSHLDIDMASPFHISDVHTSGSTLANTSIWPTALILSLLLYVASYALGLGNVPWQQGELFPLSVRSLGSGIATSTNWGANTIVGLTFLPMMEFLSPSVTFVVYAAVCVIAWISVRGYYPETMGLSLEEVGQLLREGWGVWSAHDVSRGREA